MAFLVDRCLLLDVLLNLLLNIVFLFYVLRFLVVRMDQLGCALLFVLRYWQSLVALILVATWAWQWIAPLINTGYRGCGASIVLISCILWEHKDMWTSDWADRSTVWRLLVRCVTASFGYFRVVEEVVAVALRRVLILLSRSDWHRLIAVVRELAAVRRSNWLSVASDVLKIVWRLTVEHTLAVNEWMCSGQDKAIFALPFLTEDLTFSI